MSQLRNTFLLALFSIAVLASGLPIAAAKPNPPLYGLRPNAVYDGPLKEVRQALQQETHQMLPKCFALSIVAAFLLATAG